MTNFQDELTEEERQLLAEENNEELPTGKHLKTKIKKIFKVKFFDRL